MMETQLIAMAGLPGSGKSTIANALSRQLPAMLLSVDPIEAALRRSGWQKEQIGIAGYLVVEALADDGTVEAIRVESARTFALGVQWHAEHDPVGQPVNAPLWQAFRDAMG